MGKLDYKVAIITGAAQGMGAMHARKFAEEGAKVVVTDLNEEAGKALVEEIGENAVFMKLDVSKSANWEEVIALTEEKFGPVTVLVNNAGVGSIVNISSVDGLVSASTAIAYSASKHAVTGMTKGAAAELGPFNIRVNSVHPGIIETPMAEQGDVYEYIKQLEKDIPLRRTAKPEEVSNLVIYLASDDSSYSTGAQFVVDGGMISDL